MFASLHVVSYDIIPYDRNFWSLNPLNVSGVVGTRNARGFADVIGAANFAKLSATGLMPDIRKLTL